ncbi:DNA primase [subsurface metagenome]
MGIDYWEGRGFDKEEAEFFDIRLDQESYRIIIPVKDIDGVNKFYIGRGISEFVKPKYLLSEGSKKSNYVYNIHNAKNFETVFLFEGPLDVISGGKDCIAILGKDLGDGQLNQLRQTNIKKIFIGLDTDALKRDIMKIKEKMRMYFDFEVINFPEKGDLNDMRIKFGKKGVRIFLENLKMKP